MQTGEAALTRSVIRPMVSARTTVTLVLPVLLGVLALFVAFSRWSDVGQPVRIALLVGGVVLVGVAQWFGLSRALGGKLPCGLFLGVLWLSVLCAVAAFAGDLPLAESRNPGKTLFEPALATPDLFSAHPLGTDRHGLDILGGLAYGARVSLTVGLGATLIGCLVGMVIGLTAGFVRGGFDALVGLLTDSMLAFPPLILLIGVVAVMRPSVMVVTLSLALLTVPGYVRLSRAHTLALVPRGFVITARAMGASRIRIIFKELLPNVVWPLLSYSIVVVAAMIVAEASLSYLGLSVQRPNPTWGNMIAAGQDSYQEHPHLVLVPAVAMFLTVLSLNAVGEQLRSRLGGGRGA